jgi:hypothetical protein
VKASYSLLICITALLLVSCNSTQAQRPQEKTALEAILFEDPMAANWQENWFLDGENALLEHRDGGLAFITEYKVDKNEDRDGFDAQHAVLWTRQEFDGDIRITYTYTKLPDCSWQKLIYVQAQGIGEEPYVEDIYAWKDLRKVSVMSEYFDHMNLIGLSLRNEVRCRRYPWSDVKRNVQLDNEFLPRAQCEKMPIGREYHVVVEKRKKSIWLRITDAETGEVAVDQTWDLTDKKVLKNRNPEYIEKGRIGLRHMGGFKAVYRDFKVTQLGGADTAKK